MKIDLNKVYDVVKGLITHLFDILKTKGIHGIETFFIDRVSNKENFYGKIIEKMCTKT